MYLGTRSGTCQHRCLTPSRNFRRRLSTPNIYKCNESVRYGPSSVRPSFRYPRFCRGRSPTLALSASVCVQVCNGWNPSDSCLERGRIHFSYALRQGGVSEPQTLVIIEATTECPRYARTPLYKATRPWTAAAVLSLAAEKRKVLNCLSFVARTIMR